MKETLPSSLALFSSARRPSVFTRGCTVTYNPCATQGQSAAETFQRNNTNDTACGRHRRLALLKLRIFSIALALALSAATIAPQTTLAGRVSNAPLSRAATARANDADKASASPSDSSDEETQAKRKGNGFARALGAPFRAIARLFGGGKKSTSEEAKRRKTSTPQATAASAKASNATPAPKQTTDANAAPAVTPEVNKAEPAAVASAPEVKSPRPVEVKSPSPATATRPAEGARVVRPDETGAIVEPPKMWIPVIEGISKDPLTQGRALLEHGYVQEAISELSIAATQVGPTLAEANNLLGIAYDRIGWHKQAVEAYNRALTVAPKDPIAIANLGYSLYLANDYAGALKRLKQAAKLSPGQPVIYNNLGIVTAALSKYDEAYKYFVIASNDYDAHLKLASILEDQHRDRDAIKHYEAALAMQPGASAILERLVALYERTGERDKADMARRALGQPKNPQKTTTGGGGG
jgi:Flp pilus assembly protein TadD/cytoskeletal protein RodZ